MLRAIRRHLVKLIVPFAVAPPVVAGLAWVGPEVAGLAWLATHSEDPGKPCECHRGPEFDRLRGMNYGPDEIVYLGPDRTPIRFGDLPRAITPEPTASADACSSPPGGPGARPIFESSTR